MKLEKTTGVVFSNSPTLRVGDTVLKDMKKVKHDIPLKSLQKTKNIEEIKSFIGDKECMLMLKCDGLTNELKYNNKKFIQGSTRGDAYIGEEITDNVMQYKNVPLTISECGNITVVGEAIITKKDFLEINSKLSDEDKKSNPRNLVAGSVRVLNPSITKERRVKFLAFGILEIDNKIKTKEEQLKVLEELGFEVAPYCLVNSNNIEESISKIKNIAEELSIPYDGMVISYNDLNYAMSLGDTAKFPKWAKAFKFEDEFAETKLLDIIYEPSRNGVLTPVAVFEPVELEGTIVEKATLHNITVLKALKLGIGDMIEVYKANQIIPQVSTSLTESNTYRVIDKCPVCGVEVELRGDFLYCTNEDCDCRIIKKLVHFTSRNALNIKGLSEKTLAKLINNELITDYKSIFNLNDKISILYNVEKLGKKSVDNLLEGIETARNTDFYRFIYSLGINNIGLETAKIIAKNIKPDDLFNLDLRQVMSIEGLGTVASEKFYNYIEDNKEMLEELIKEFNFKVEEVSEDSASTLEGKIFVITGSVHIFKNRNEIKDKVEELGGKVSGSVSKNTDYLINNEIESTSSKNKKAKDLGIPIITEEQFLELIK